MSMKTTPVAEPALHLWSEEPGCRPGMRLGNVRVRDQRIDLRFETTLAHPDAIANPERTAENSI